MKKTTILKISILGAGLITLLGCRPKGQRLEGISSVSSTKTKVAGKECRRINLANDPVASFRKANNLVRVDKKAHLPNNMIVFIEGGQQGQNFQAYVNTNDPLLSAEKKNYINANFPGGQLKAISKDGIFRKGWIHYTMVTGPVDCGDYGTGQSEQQKLEIVNPNIDKVTNFYSKNTKTLNMDWFKKTRCLGSTDSHTYEVYAIAKNWRILDAAPVVGAAAGTVAGFTVGALKSFGVLSIPLGKIGGAAGGALAGGLVSWIPQDHATIDPSKFQPFIIIREKGNTTVGDSFTDIHNFTANPMIDGKIFRAKDLHSHDGSVRLQAMKFEASINDPTDPKKKHRIRNLKFKLGSPVSLNSKEKNWSAQLTHEFPNIEAKEDQTIKLQCAVDSLVKSH